MSLSRYVYDLPIPAGADPTLFEPRPSDGEVESFEVRLFFLWSSRSIC